MDETDINILRLLKENSRESLGKMAEELGVSKATVSRRIARMEKGAYISGYTITLDPSKLGLMRAIISLQVVGTAVNSVVDELKKVPEIEYVQKVFGDHNLICNVYATSVDSLYELIQNRLLKISNIHNVEVDILVEKMVMNPNAELNMINIQSPRQR
jgi:DNA-binding Lrp family transcriptional regulator